MPDNRRSGELEDFVQTMIPEGDPICPLSQKYIDDIPSEEREFSEGKELRAKLHAWLATRKEPGRMGSAVGRGDLQVDDVLCQDVPEVDSGSVCVAAGPVSAMSQCVSGPGSLRTVGPPQEPFSPVWLVGPQPTVDSPHRAARLRGSRRDGFVADPVLDRAVEQVGRPDGRFASPHRAAGARLMWHGCWRSCPLPSNCATNADETMHGMMGEEMRDTDNPGQTAGGRNRRSDRFAQGGP